MDTDPPIQTTKVKVCGITRLQDAEAAAAAGAWALGMIMWRGSARYVPPQQAAEIVDAVRRRVEIAGVFVDQPLDDVVELANEIGLSVIQLHGDEGQQYCKAVAQRTAAKVVKAFRVRGRDVMREMGRFHDVDFHLLDTYKAGVPGGTGETFDWSFLAGRRPSRVPLILSGGLNPENVAGAIELVGPYAVDVSSGVESGPGVKDPKKIEALMAAVAGAVPAGRPRKEQPATGAAEEVLTLAFQRRQQEKKSR